MDRWPGAPGQRRSVIAGRLPGGGFVPHRGAASLGTVGLHVRGELVRLAEQAAAAAMLGSSALVVHDFLSRSMSSAFSLV